MQAVIDTIVNYFAESGFGQALGPAGLGNLVMIGVGLLFIWLAVKKGFEPLLLVPIGFGILIGNIPYNSATLPLSVYDGPVSDHDIHYFSVDPEAATRVVDGESTPLSVRIDEWEATHLEDLRDEVKADIKALPGEDPGDEELKALADKEVPEGSVHLGHSGLMTLIYETDQVRFDETHEITDHVAAITAAEQGKAIMVNRHSLLSAGSLPEGFEAPGIFSLGQGRYVFVEKPREDGKYPQVWSVRKQDVHNASIFWWLFAGVGLAGFYPPLIFLGIGALTDFGPMLSNPKTLLLGAAAQFGIFGALLGAVAIFGFDMKEAASIGIIGGADGPTAIFTCSQLAPHLLGAVALAAYSYMAMVPIIQPPIIRALTTKAERKIHMTSHKPVTKSTKIMFPIAGFILTAFIAPGGLPLLGMLFFGNLLRESMVTDRLAKTAQTTFIDIVTILLGVTVGAKTSAANFLTIQTIFIFILGILAFGVATATGVLFGKFLNKVSKEPINPMIGAAGVSAVPMAARVVHKCGQEEDPQNFLLMHAMGPNVAGVIGSAVAAGVLLSKLAVVH